MVQKTIIIQNSVKNRSNVTNVEFIIEIQKIGKIEAVKKKRGINEAATSFNSSSPPTFAKYHPGYLLPPYDAPSPRVSPVSLIRESHCRRSVKSRLGQRDRGRRGLELLTHPFIPVPPLVMGCLATLLDRRIVDVAGGRVLEMVIDAGDGTSLNSTGTGVRARGRGEVARAATVGACAVVIVGGSVLRN